MRAKTLLLSLSLLPMAGALHAAETYLASASGPRDCPPPVLPIAAMREGMSGDVTLQYQDNAQGRVTDIRILKSSGFKELDKAAIIALSRCKPPVLAAGAELPPPGTTEYKFGRPTRVTSSSKPVLIAGSCAPSERFTSYIASTYDLATVSSGASIRFMVNAAGAPYAAASYEHDKALAADAIAYIQTCRFEPAKVNGAATIGSSDGFIQLKQAP